MGIGILIVAAGLALGPSQERRLVDVPAKVHAVTVHVVDVRGEPVAHANVRATVEPADGSKRVRRSGTADLEGDVRFEEMPAGKLELRQSPFNLLGGAADVTLDLEGDVESMLRVPGFLVYGGRVSGEAGSDRNVTLETAEEHGIAMMVRRAPLAQDGRFTFNGLSPGRYLLAVEERGDPTFGWIPGKRVRVFEFELSESKTDERLEIPPLGAVAVVLAGETEGRGTFWVDLWNQEDDIHRDNLLGGSCFTDLPPGRYRLRVKEQLRERFGHRLIRDLSFELGPRELELEIEVPILVVWARFAASELPSRGIRGRLTLTDPSGHRLEQQDWRLSRNRRGDGLDVDDVDYGQIGNGIRSRGDQLELVGVAPGHWSLLVETPGYEPASVAFEAHDGMVIDVELERMPGRVVRVQVDDWRYELLVRAAASGEPWRRLLWDAGVHATHTPPVGVFEAHLAPGSYELLLHSRKLADALVGPVEIEDDVEPLVLPIAPERGHELRGRLFLEPGIPVEASLHVWAWENGAWTPRPEKRAWASVEADPPFTIQGLSAGTYRLTLDPAGAHPVGGFEMGAADRTLDVVLEH